MTDVPTDRAALAAKLTALARELSDLDDFALPPTVEGVRDALLDLAGSCGQPQVPERWTIVVDVPAVDGKGGAEPAVTPGELVERIEDEPGVRVVEVRFPGPGDDERVRAAVELLADHGSALARAANPDYEHHAALRDWIAGAVEAQVADPDYEQATDRAESTLRELAGRTALVEVETRDGDSVHGQLVDFSGGLLLVERADCSTALVRVEDVERVEEVDA